jgi:hypothetical protein
MAGTIALFFRSAQQHVVLGFDKRGSAGTAEWRRTEMMELRKVQAATLKLPKRGSGNVTHYVQPMIWTLSLRPLRHFEKIAFSWRDSVRV